MSIDVSHYIGAYLEIKVSDSTFKKRVRSCQNGHDSRGDFCAVCGGKVEDREVTENRFPRLWDIIGDEFEDELVNATPDYPGDGEEDLLFALPNQYGDFQLIKHNSLDFCGAVALGQDGVVEKTISAFGSKYGNIIQYIRSNESVVHAEIRFGYVVKMS